MPFRATRAHRTPSSVIVGEHAACVQVVDVMHRLAVRSGAAFGLRSPPPYRHQFTVSVVCQKLVHGLTQKPEDVSAC